MPAACSWLWIQFCHSWIRIFVSFAIFDGSILFRWIWPWANFRSAIQIYTFLAKRQSMSLAWFQTHFARRSSSSNIRKRSLVDCIGFEGNQATFYKRFWSHKEHSWCKLKVDPICWLLIIVQISNISSAKMGVWLWNFYEHWRLHPLHFFLPPSHFHLLFSYKQVSSALIRSYKFKLHFYPRPRDFSSIAADNL